MGSSKKHKRDSKKHKRRSRSRSRSRSPRYEREREREQDYRSRSYSEDNDSYNDAVERRRHKKHKRDQNEHRHLHSRQHEPQQHSRDSRNQRDYGEVNTIDDDSDSSDCVEVPLDEPDVPPPPPSISRKSPDSDAVPSPPPPPQVQKRRRSPTPPPAPKASASRKRSVSPIPSNGAGDVLSVGDTNKLRAKLGLRPLEVTPSKSQAEQSSSRRRHRSPSPPPPPKASSSSRKRSVSPIPDNGAGDVLSVDESNKLRAKLGLRPLETSSKKRVRSPSPPLPPKTSSSATGSRKRSASPIPENGAGDSLSIEETNKLRAKLGLRPLDVSASKSDSTPSKGTEAENTDKLKDDWGEFYHKPAKNLSEKTQEEKIREKLKERREKRAIEEKLKRLKTLGEEDEVDDLKGWVAKTRDKDRLRKEAAERARLLDQMDEELEQDSEFSGGRSASSRRSADTKASGYRDRDLKGLRVEHDVEAFTEGRQVILTLKDANVLDEEAGDTLVNVNMIDDERYKRNVEARKANPQHYGYDVYCQDDVDEFGMPKEREVLGKYNEEIEGQRKSSFVIGSNAEHEAQEKRRLLEIKTKLEKKKLDSLETAQLTLVSDYFTETELASFKKPKKKVRKIRQKLRADDLLASLPAEETTSDLGSRSKRSERSGGPSATVTSEDRKSIRSRAADILLTDDTPAISEDLSTVKLEDAIEDDEDLQAALQKARRLKQKEAIISKALPIDPERVKSEVKEEPDSGGELDHHGTMLLNSTAEFCRTLGDIPTYGTAGNREEDPNDMMDFERDSASDREGMDSDPEEGPSRRHHHHHHHNNHSEHSGTWNSVNTEQEQEETRETKVEEVAILDEEPDVALSVAGALKLAQSKGYLEREESNRPSNARFAHLQAQNYSIEDKNYGEENDKYSRRDRYAGPIMDFKEKETFKPNVKLEYIDDNGHLLTPKEAFRYLSHKFHGKGPGKNKVEKRLKKSEQEGLMKKMSSTDTPLGTLNMLQAKQKETQSPFIVLSGTKQNTSIVKQKR
ncbi:U4/U6.U5 tri-snRNP-associated protein 1 [Anopheles nili]|uniref:U4/U6.U5 tri-snRNP-associated protein 1 n=1 Tax=Anopheles nili TaxID=185578 RepID=UPI00237C03F8|nr:U4/U6.U5 tri-snRNP-associated protein 1 [Anopheles nili]